jgi:hypothetical protein
MKNKYVVQILSVMCLVLSFCFLTSCNDDGESNNGQVELLSFGPSGVRHGDEIVFIGKNLNKVSTIVLAPNVEVTTFTAQSSDQIKIVIPPDAEAGKVSLKFDGGEIESKTMLNLDVPVVVSTMTHEAKPGTNVTISGDKLNWVESVTFTDKLTVKKADFVSQSISELVVKVPTEAKTGFLTFSTGGTKPTTFDSEEPLVVTLPAVTALNPSSIRHASNLTIAGTNLDLVTKIDFPGGTSITAGSFVSQSVSQIVVTVPVNTTDGKLKLTVPSKEVVETTQTLTIILPKVTAFSPNSSPGATLTITGTDLDLVQEIFFPSVTASVSTFTSKTPTQIVVTIPAGAAGGTMKFKTIHNFMVNVTVPFGDQSLLLYTVYDDALQSTWQLWGWGGPADIANTEQSVSGAKSCKKTYTGAYEGLQLGNGSVAAASYAKVSVSIFGGPGTNGKNVRLIINGSYGVYPTFTLVEGQWKEFTATWSQVNNPTTITEIVLQSEFAGTIYVDKLGLK